MLPGSGSGRVPGGGELALRLQGVAKALLEPSRRVAELRHRLVVPGPEGHVVGGVDQLAQVGPLVHHLADDRPERRHRLHQRGRQRALRRLSPRDAAEGLDQLAHGRDLSAEHVGLARLPPVEGEQHPRGHVVHVDHVHSEVGEGDHAASARRGTGSSAGRAPSGRPARRRRRAGRSRTAAPPRRSGASPPGAPRPWSPRSRTCSRCPGCW